MLHVVEAIGGRAALARRHGVDKEFWKRGIGGRSPTGALEGAVCVALDPVLLPAFTVSNYVVCDERPKSLHFGAGRRILPGRREVDGYADLHWERRRRDEAARPDHIVVRFSWARGRTWHGGPWRRIAVTACASRGLGSPAARRLFPKWNCTVIWARAELQEVPAIGAIGSGPEPVSIGVIPFSKRVTAK